MTKRVWALLLALGLCCSGAGCGDDDSGDDNGGSSGSGSNAGSGTGNAGTGNAGTGNAGTGSGGLEECMLDEMMMGGSTANCEGIEAYSACVENMCSYEQCNTDCSAYFDCVQNAADPCNPSGCPAPSGACASCLANVGTCTLNNCFSLIMCGETMPGGACDQLDDCCAMQPQQMQMLCMTAAMGARAAGGDAICQPALGAFCMMM